MSFLFKPKPKSPAELVKNTKECIAKLESSQGDVRKSNEEISKNVIQMKNILYGDGDNDPVPEMVAQLATEVVNSDLLVSLIQNIQLFEFEAKKDVAQIFNNLLRRQIGTRFPTADYIAGKPDVLFCMIAGYENQDISLNCGMILREALRHEALAKIILESPQFWNFFNYVELSTFDVASDAFVTFKDCLTKHKTLVAGFLESHYDIFFEKYYKLLTSSNYVTKRQSLKLLGELLLDRSNYVIMTNFISGPENLKLMMTLLREKSRNIQFEAFHVFKIFIANPVKTKPILDILYKNKQRLVDFLSQFHNDRTDDEQFNDEKQFLIKQIMEL
ncbi:Mo25-like protein [Globomyces pollinis-pini]|nr:Mo25-like protein [Globomyces pollinis-pini]KAJ2999500.1 Calcium-binding protein 39 [Globomyces sp. JEL0801]